jgi:hypothetical protein
MQDAFVNACTGKHVEIIKLLARKAAEERRRKSADGEAALELA